jgi:predicted enzyme related to lactoylglutathione lyase
MSTMSKRNVVHVEIPASDVQAAGTFYQELLGWKITHDQTLNYAMWEAADGTGGGFPQVSAESPAGQVLVYIHSDDIDADLRKVEQLGGTVVHPKMEIPNTGWFGLFKDPTGNVLGLYTSMNPNFGQ